MSLGRKRFCPLYKRKDPALISKVAEDLRTEFGIANQRAPNMLILLSQAKSKYRLRIKELPDYRLPIVDAWVDCKKKILHLRETVSYSLKLNNNGQVRWIIAHEIGHIALGHPRSHFHKTKSDLINPEERIYEAEADAFALDFLAPLRLAQKFHSWEDLKGAFQLPTSAAKRRFAEIQRLQKVGQIFEPIAIQPTEIEHTELDFVDVFPPNDYGDE